MKVVWWKLYLAISCSIFLNKLCCLGIPWCDLKAVLGQGQTFGEIAFLQGEGQRRTATIITKTGRAYCPVYGILS